MTNYHQYSEVAPIRRVRFAEKIDYDEVQILEATADAADDDDFEQTCSPRAHETSDEFNDRKFQRKLEAGELVSKGYGVLLWGSFEDKEEVNAQKHLTVFARLPDPICARGLERRLCKKQDRERREWQAKCIQDVLDLESRISYEGKGDSKKDAWESIAFASRKASRNAKRFARRLAKADEYVVQKGELEDLKDALKLIDEIRTLQMESSATENRYADLNSASGGRRRKSANSAKMMMTSQQTTKESPRRKKSTPRRSMSDRPRGNPARQQAALDEILAAKSTEQKTNKDRPKASKPQRMIKRWNSFQKLTTMDQKEEETPKEKPGKRSMLQQWNTWSKKSSKPTAAQERALGGSLSSFLVPVSALVGDDEEVEEEPMKDDSSDIDDSMVFYGRANPPGKMLATLDEGDQSFNELESLGYFDVWEAGAKTSPEVLPTRSGRRQKRVEKEGLPNLRPSFSIKGMVNSSRPRKNKSSDHPSSSRRMEIWT